MMDIKEEILAQMDSALRPEFDKAIDNTIEGAFKEDVKTLGFMVANSIKCQWEVMKPHLFYAYCLGVKAQEAKAQAVPAKLVLELEKGRFKEYEFKALLRQSLRASKVTRSKLNWVHVMSMLGTGSTVAHRICEALGVNPDGTEFKAQEPAND